MMVCYGSSEDSYQPKHFPYILQKGFEYKMHIKSSYKILIGLTSKFSNYKINFNSTTNN